MFSLLRVGKVVNQKVCRPLYRQKSSLVAPVIGSSNGQQENWTKFLKLTGFFVGACVLGNHEAENCGIVGVVGSSDSKEFLLEGLTILRNRGYDSAGIASLSDDNKLLVTKYASRDTTSDSIDLVRAASDKHTGHNAGIGHTRWATHGGKTDFNAHPHTDSKKRVAVVHNGTINNSYELRKLLTSQGVEFTSETDTEVIAHLIGQYLDNGLNTKDAVSKALGRYIYVLL